ncbi:MAG: ABC transporter substrate-binding protein [Sphaerochaetaceae bacterium]
MKKVLFLFLILSILVTPLFAKGSQEAKGPLVLTYWTHEDPNRTKIEERYIKEFEAANPNIKIERTTQSSSKIIELVQTAFAANSGPDIFDLSNADNYVYIANHRVAPVNAQAMGYASQQALEETFLDGILDSVKLDGKIYALMYEFGNYAIMVNKKVFRSAGLDPEKDYPRTWEDMVEVSKKLVLRDGEILTRRGFDFRYAHLLTSMMPMIIQLGGEIKSSSGEYFAGEEAWLTWLRFLQQWGPNGMNLGSPTYKAPRSLFNSDNNDIAMCMTGLYQAARMEEENPSFYDSKEWMYIPNPVFKNAVQDVSCFHYGQYYLVNAQSSAEKQEAAWKFIGYMMSHGEEYLSEAALLQPTKKLLESDQYKNIPYSDVFANEIARSRASYTGANSGELQILIRTAMESVMLSGVTPEKAYATLKAAAKELD